MTIKELEETLGMPRAWGWVSTPYGDSDILLKLEFTVRRSGDTESQSNRYENVVALKKGRGYHRGTEKE